MKKIKEQKFAKTALAFFALIGMIILGTGKIDASTKMNGLNEVKQDTIKPKKEQISNLDEVFEKTDTPAEPILEGKFNKFRRNFQEKFDSRKMEGKRMVRSTITFVVEKDGTISNVKAEGDNSLFNDECVKATIAANEGVKWKPATRQGKEVRSVFRLPLTMSFE